MSAPITPRRRIWHFIKEARRRELTVRRAEKVRRP